MNPFQVIRLLGAAAESPFPQPAASRGTLLLMTDERVRTMVEETGLRAIDLFAGAGGMALGLEAAGFKLAALLDHDPDATATLVENAGVAGRWTGDLVKTADVASYDFSALGAGVDLCSAGVPCQPWSQGGLHAGYDDHRDMFPALLQAVVAVRPMVVLVENVSGLTRYAFDDYVGHVKLRLSHPSAVALPGEDWRQFDQRLRQEVGAGRGAEYIVESKTCDAADFGVPQRRKRIFIQAVRATLGSTPFWPMPTHSSEALREAIADGAYHTEHGIPGHDHLIGDEPTTLHIVDGRLRWRTVRDALRGLEYPAKRGVPGIDNHVYVSGARSYPGHTGSPWDQPAKTIKAGVHGVGGGENMLRHPNGKLRYFSIREAARLQTFPDQYKFPETRSIAMRQIGNAVPVDLARAIGAAIAAGVKASIAANAEAASA